MSPQAWLLLGTVITAVGALIGTALLIRQQGRQTKTTDAQQIIDQLQEMRAEDEERHRADVADVRHEVADLRSRVQRMESRELAFFDYVATLRWHIDQRNPPPPPPWPAVLMNRD